MVPLQIFGWLFVWIYVFWAIGQLIRKWKAKRDYQKALHPKKRWLRPLRGRRKREEPERRILYRPPNKER